MSKKRFQKSNMHLFLVAACIGFGATALAAPRLQTGPDAEVTYDGLHRVDKSVMDAAWVKPDLDLTGYTKLMLVPVGISYRAVDDQGRTWRPGRSSATEFPISEAGKKRIAQELSSAFREELGRSTRYELVKAPGPGVLALEVGLLDVVSGVPPVNTCAGRCDVYLKEVGEATLVVQLRDSLSNEVLARAVDRRAAESSWPINANSVTVWPEVRRLGQTWARLIRTRLDQFTTVDDMGNRRR